MRLLHAVPAEWGITHTEYHMTPLATSVGNWLVGRYNNTAQTMQAIIRFLDLNQLTVPYAIYKDIENHGKYIAMGKEY